MLSSLFAWEFVFKFMACGQTEGLEWLGRAQDAPSNDEGCGAKDTCDGNALDDSK